jgi:hypothetical protein
MTRGRTGRATCLLVACVLAGACNEADVIATPVMVVRAVDAGLDCSLSGQLARHNLPNGIGNVYTPSCEWPLTQTDSVDSLRTLFDIGIRSDTKAQLCAIDPTHVWQEPLPPLPPQKLVFCQESCQWVRDWLSCRLRDDPCMPHNEDDAGTFYFCPP